MVCQKQFNCVEEKKQSIKKRVCFYFTYALVFLFCFVGTLNKGV